MWTRIVVLKKVNNGLLWFWYCQWENPKALNSLFLPIQLHAILGKAHRLPKRTGLVDGNFTAFYMGLPHV